MGKEQELLDCSWAMQTSRLLRIDPAALIL